MSVLSYRSIFISDVHLGTRNCKADYLLDFLQSSQSEYLYLVGDVFDLWEMKRAVHWMPKQTEVLTEIFKKASEGTRVFYIPGNHDATFRQFIGSEVEGVKILQDAVHLTADGRKFFVSHGDEFDSEVRHNRFLHYLGDHLYSTLLWLNRVAEKSRRLLNRPYWSLSGWLKSRVGNASVYIDKFESLAANRAEKGGYSGYICGHIHKAGIRKIDGALYCNDGDWVEHCTALVEDDRGWLQLLHWSDHYRVEAVASSDGEAVDSVSRPLLRPSALPAKTVEKPKRAA